MPIIPRYDVFELDLPSLKEDSSTGFLTGFAFLTSSDVYPYLDQDGGLVYEARLPEDVFNKDSMESAKMLPVTNEHPYTQLNKNNTKRYQVGNLGSDIKQHEDGFRLYSEIIITDGKTIKDIKDKKRIEISMGYTVNLIKEDGYYRDKHYSHRHTQIKYNHAAITITGRAGDTVGLVTDSKIENVNSYRFDSQFKVIKDIIPKTPKGSNNMDVEVIIDGKKVMVPQAVADHMAKQDTDLKASNAKTDSSSGALKKISDELEIAKGKADSLENQLEKAKKVDHSAEIQKRVDARRTLEVKAKKVLGDDFDKHVNDSDRDLKIAMITKSDDTFKATKETTELYLDSYLAGVMSMIGKKHTGSFNEDSSNPPPAAGSGDALTKARADTQKAEDELDKETYDYKIPENAGA